MNIKNALSQYAIDSISNGLAPVTIRVYVNAIKKFAAFIGPETGINLITPQQARAFYAYLRVEHRGPRMDNPDKLSSASLHRYWKSLRSFFNWSHTEFDLDPPDKNLKSPKYSNKEILPYSKSEIQRLLSVCEYTAPIRRSTATYDYQFRLPDPLRNRAIIMTLLDTGIRPSELCRLRMNNLKEDGHKIEVLPFIEGKTKTRTLEIQSITRTAILKYHQTRPPLEANDFIFAKINGGGLTKDALGCMIRRLGSRAHIPDCSVYRFRHTFAVEYLRNGGDVFTLQYFLGHSNIKTTKQYISFTNQDREHAHKLASPVNNWKLS
jgi:integrase/recombinase XerD